MSALCVFTFANNSQGVFYSGHTVIGSIEIITAQPKIVRGIYVSSIGVGEVRWIKKTPHHDRDGRYDVDDEVFESIDNYLSAESYVLGQRHGPPIDFPAGRYTYEFEIQLPSHLPSSFSGTYGQIQYEVTVTIKNYKSSDNVFRKPFTVIKPLNLNLDQVYRAPLECEEEKVFWCGCCTIEPLLVRVRIPNSGYASGQKIPMKINVINDSNFDISGLDVRLRKHIKYHVEEPRPSDRFEDFKISSEEFGKILRLSRKEFNVMLRIPPTQPSTLNSCKIITISYNIKIVARTPSFHRNCSIVVPIVIGTVPLVEIASPDFVMTQPTRQQHQRRQSPRRGQSDASIDRPPAYDPLAPPSYEEAVYQSNAFRNSNRNSWAESPDSPYMPVYPLYPSSPTDTCRSAVCSLSSSFHSLMNNNTYNDNYNLNNNARPIPRIQLNSQDIDTETTVTLIEQNADGTLSQDAYRWNPV